LEPLSPKNSKTVSIKFDCETLGQNFDVSMFSTQPNKSTLVFHKQNTHHDFLVYRGAFLRLDFDVKPYNSGNSHELGIKFSFKHPLVHLVVPLFPFFVLVNGLEDLVFLNRFKDGFIAFNENPMFSLYRLYIFTNELESS
jgi:hypothetical protein